MLRFRLIYTEKNLQILYLKMKRLHIAFGPRTTVKKIVSPLFKASNKKRSLLTSCKKKKKCCLGVPMMNKKKLRHSRGRTSGLVCCHKPEQCIMPFVTSSRKRPAYKDQPTKTGPERPDWSDCISPHSTVKALFIF